MSMLVKEYPLGVQINFRYHVEAWQKSNITENEPNTNITSSHVIPSSSCSSSLEMIKLDKNQSIQCIIPSKNPNIEVSNILNSTQGALIIDYYKKHNSINDNIRTLLVEIIIQELITKKILMSVSLAEEIADQIQQLFPSELKENYSIKDCSRQPKGKLYCKYYNTMRTLKSSGLISKQKSIKKITKSRNFSSWTSNTFEPEEDVQLILNQIKHDNCSLPELERHWSSTVNYRLNEIQKATSTQEIIKEWRSYKLPMGYKLIDIDFNVLHPNCFNVLGNYELKLFSIFNILTTKIKDISSRKLLESLNEIENPCENAKQAVTFYLLHSLLVPTTKKVTRDDKGRKNIIKFSIKDSQNTFVVFCSTVSQAEELISNKYSLNMPIQPFILIIGTPLQPKEIIVYFDTIKYKVFTVLRAIDVCFKI
ncbi:unnamed protein product, partial [Aphis gossypii]